MQNNTGDNNLNPVAHGPRAADVEDDASDMPLDVFVLTEDIFSEADLEGLFLPTSVSPRKVATPSPPHPANAHAVTQL